MHSSQGQSVDTLNHISSILGFKFHEGFNRKLEIKLVKYILVRETQVMKLNHLSFTSMHDDSNSKMLDLMVPIREATLNVIEATVTWRESLANYDPATPPIYMWEGVNYLMKVVHDLDFLAENRRFMYSIGTDPAKMRSNPLMLSNNLEDVSAVVDPFHRAGLDAGGKYFGPLFDERLRLRKAERVLLVELECSRTISRAVPTEVDAVDESSPNQKPTNEFFAGKLVERDKKRKEIGRRKVLAALKSARGGSVKKNFAFEIDVVTDAPEMEPAVENELASRNQIRNDDYINALAVQQKLEKRGKLRSSKGDPKESEISASDIFTMSSIMNPNSRLQLLAASCVILVADGFEIPEDISWNTFQDQTSLDGDRSAGEFAMRLNSLDYKKVPNFKVVAMTPFLPQLTGSGLDELEFELNALYAIRKVNDLVVSIIENASKLQSESEEALAVNSSPLVPIQTNTTRLRRLQSETAIQKLNASEEWEKALNSGSVALRPNGIKDPRNALKLIPKINLQMYPFHTVISESIYEDPIVVALLSPMQPSEIRAKKSDPAFLFNYADIDRLVVKVFDPITSIEGSAVILLREFELFFKDLSNQNPGDIRPYFNPGSVSWWSDNVDKLLMVKLNKKTKQLSVIVSKVAIERLVTEGLGNRSYTPSAEYSNADKMSFEQIEDVDDNDVIVPSAATTAPARATATVTAGAALPSSKPPLAKKIEAAPTGKRDNKQVKPNRSGTVSPADITTDSTRQANTPSPSAIPDKPAAASKKAPAQLGNNPKAITKAPGSASSSKTPSSTKIVAKSNAYSQKTESTVASVKPDSQKKDVSKSLAKIDSKKSLVQSTHEKIAQNRSQSDNEGSIAITSEVVETQPNQGLSDAGPGSDIQPLGQVVMESQSVTALDSIESLTGNSATDRYIAGLFDDDSVGSGDDYQYDLVADVQVTPAKVDSPKLSPKPVATIAPATDYYDSTSLQQGSEDSDGATYLAVVNEMLIKAMSQKTSGPPETVDEYNLENEFEEYDSTKAETSGPPKNIVINADDDEGYGDDFDVASPVKSAKAVSSPCNNRAIDSTSAVAAAEDSYEEGFENYPQNSKASRKPPANIPSNTDTDADAEYGDEFEEASPTKPAVANVSTRDQNPVVVPAVDCAIILVSAEARLPETVPAVEPTPSTVALAPTAVSGRAPEAANAPTVDPAIVLVQDSTTEFVAVSEVSSAQVAQLTQMAESGSPLALQEKSMNPDVGLSQASVGSVGSHDSLSSHVRNQDLMKHPGLHLPQSEPSVSSAQSQAQEQAAAEFPLPPEWAQYYDDQGRVYYYNATTDASSWDHPVMLELGLVMNYDNGETAAGTNEYDNQYPVGWNQDQYALAEGGAEAQYYDETGYDHGYEVPANVEPLSLDALPTLPADWVEYQTNSGRTYYYSESKQESSWDRPIANE